MQFLPDSALRESETEGEAIQGIRNMNLAAVGMDAAELNSEHSMDGITKTEEHQNLYREQEENESNKSDRDNDDDKMNVFGFNDDLGPLLDDRLIINNPTENARYNVVERPRYLL